MAAIEVQPATFRMGRVVTRTFNVLGDKFVPYATIAAFFVSPPMLVSYLIARSFPVYVGVFSPQFVRYYAYLLLNSLFQVLLTYFFRAILVQDSIARFDGDSTGLDEAWSSGRIASIYYELRTSRKVRGRSIWLKCLPDQILSCLSRRRRPNNRRDSRRPRSAV